MVKKSSLLLLLFLLLCAPSYSQEDTKEETDKLTGKTDKVWVFQRFEKYMGNDKCKSGESWTFYSDSRVVIKKCVNREIKADEKHWSIHRVSSLDVALKVDDVEYLLIFPPPKPGTARQSMILRQKAQSKVSPTKDLIFYYEVD
ncbi:MAG TPA: hypothetical protein VJ464_30495 [Blastocatellia bacterium]|nr:hypothetical protein [Blastocatellia bacterium]